MGLEDKMPAGYMLGKLEDLVGWVRSSSMWPVTMGLACCAIEMMAAGTSRFDISRFGMEVFRASPRQADLMIVSGRLSHKMAPVIRTVYDQMSDPKWVISMGVCASSGGMFNNYAIVQGRGSRAAGGHLPARLPAPPEMLINAILELHEQVVKQTPLASNRDEVRRKVEAAALEATPTHQMKGLLA